MIEASVIIPTHNRREFLEYCLVHILNQTTDNYEVILIDDASTDGTHNLIGNWKLEIGNLRYIRLERQSGPYVARNIGIREAKGDIIIFIDSDVLVHSRFVEDHTKIHKRYDKIILQGMVHHTRVPSLATFKFFFPNAFCFRTFITQNISVRREWLEKAGGFDEFGPLMGYKDIAMGIKLQKLGLKRVYAIRSCKAYHIDGPINEENLGKLFVKQMQQGESAYFFVKNYGRMAERYAHIRKAVFISNLFQTPRWVEKEKTIRFLKESRDSPLLFIFPILKGVIRYHYRVKGINKASESDDKGFSNCSNI